MNYNPLDDEEERKRREAIAARMDEEAMGNPVGPVNPSFMDRVGTAVGNRFDQAMNRVSQAGDALMNPSDAIYNRMMNEQADEAANTEVQTTTTKQYADGSKERTVKTQEPAGQAQGGARLTTPIAGMPENLSAQGAISQEQANQPVAMAELPKPGPQVQVAGQTQMPPKAQQQQPPLPTGAVNPANYSLATGQGQPGMRLPQQPLSPTMLSQAGPAPGASLAQMGANARPTPYTPTAEREVEQPQSLPWIQAANDAGNDLNKMLDVAAKHPESRDMILEKTKLLLQNKNKEDQANAIMVAAQNGDLKAMNQIQQAIKPEKGKPKEEVTVNDYLKAVLYKRLGLDALAQQQQLKILGKETTFEQVTLGGANWQVEKDSSGNIIRAKDNEGTIATTDTLNKLRAGAQKFGTQATSFAGGLHTVPNAAGDGQDLVMPAANSIDPTKSGFIYMSGPKKGQAYDGKATPVPQSIGTDFSKNVNRAFIEFQTKPSIAAATKALETAALLSPKDYNDTLTAIRGRSPEIFNQIVSGQAGTPPVPLNAGAQGATNVQGGAQGNAGAVPPPKPAAAPPVSGPANPNATAGVGGSGLLGRTEGIKADIATNAAIKQAELKQPAEERGKQQVKQIQQQGFADSTYPLVSHISDLIKKSTGSGLGTGIDNLTRVIGVGTKGSQAIKQLETFAAPLVSMVPRFEGSQSDNDVLLYRQQAGDFANSKLTDSERLAALQGMIDLLKIYDKAGNNDWTFGGKPIAQQGGKDGKGGKQKVVKLD